MISPKHTPDQVNRSLKKLARAAARWNSPDGDRRVKESELFAAVWTLIKKTGHMNVYNETVKKEYKR